ncbi:hypothetical protein DMN91_010785 [Ooceraea biroi]|uniref:Uncharacterized protein n=1 Tax=Ooceraea biroi TaxID=2015173 RepID=A0A026W8G2_OOCBI|nr:uncharacterized protein LOC105282960 [Ooceraea biroi]EZA51314.1 hypothetical protein X777_09992 [Ooceraea biroi]RLU16717.1 hypothetical protein DMN91_010785 [Ooceraea biroi]
METVKHLWNVNQFMTKLKTPLTAELQTCYMKKCRNLSRVVELPKQNFGPSVMCPHCGSLWSTVDHQVRIAHGRKMSKSVKKIVRRMNENDGETPKVCASLAKKSIKNEKNKLVIKCSFCSKKTELPFEKKTRLKPPRLNDSEANTVQSSSKKKKKKKSKDKFAGLKIPISTPEPQLNKKDDDKTSTKIPVIAPKVNKTLPTITNKSKKLNIQRLKQIVEHSTTTPKKRSSLHSFLAELK